MNLERFHQAHDDPHAGIATALAELSAGRKRSHWIWYVFPQLAGLGRSSPAQTYAIRDLAEAQEYLQDPVLRSRYEDAANVVAEALRAGAKLSELMGSEVDAQKLVSSVTLFRAAAVQLLADTPTLAPLADAGQEILSIAETQGFPACQFTRARVNGAE